MQLLIILGIIISIEASIEAKTCGQYLFHLTIECFRKLVFLVHEWRTFNGNRDPEIDGIYVGLFKVGIPSFVGRAHYDRQFVPGRIQTSSPYGLYHPSAWSIHHITTGVEYLVNNPNYDYSWVDSTNGEFVENAVIPGYTPGRDMWYVGRIKEGDFTYLGKVHRGAKMHYEDANDAEIPTACYQVLVCTPSYECPRLL